MNQLQVFKHPMFGKVRVLPMNNEPIFNLYDVGFALGYTRPNNNGITYLRKDKLVNICESLDITGVTPSVTNIKITKDTDFENIYIKESDLYELTLESKAKHAREFRKWVTNEVLPSIRKTGGYVANDDLFIETYLPHADEQTKMTFKATLALVRKQNEQIEVMKPKAEYFDALVDRNLLTNFRDTAKELHIKQSEFINWLLSKKYVYRDQKGKLKPYAKYVPELFQLKEWERNGKADVQTLITPKGRETFRLLINKAS
jgi:phage antirepressor YoqD-like protein